MAIALGFGQGNKNTPMAGSTGGGAVQPLQMKMNPNGQLGLTTDGSGGFLNYLKGLVNPQQSAATGAAAAGALGGQAAAPAASTAGALSGGGL